MSTLRCCGLRLTLVTPSLYGCGQRHQATVKQVLKLAAVGREFVAEDLRFSRHCGQVKRLPRR